MFRSKLFLGAGNSIPRVYIKGDAVAGVDRISIETSNTKIDQSFGNDHPGIIPGNYVILSVKDSGHGIESIFFCEFIEGV